MDKRSDHDLLNEFATNRCEAAFGALVDRHIGLVYSAALRQVNDAHLAEDVTQAVFVLLARKAGTIPKRCILSGWLYRTARFIACDVIKSEARRRKREKEATQSSSLHSEQEDQWEQAEQQLDQALSRLSEIERAAILLRYFEAKSLNEVGEELGCSEEAARKRLDRAIEKLRRHFGGRNALTTSGMEQLLSSAPAHDDFPVGLTIRTSTAALADGVGAGVKVLALVERSLRSMFLTKLRHMIAAAGLPIALLLAIHHSGRRNIPTGSEIIGWHLAQSGSESLRNEHRNEAAGTSCMTCHRGDRSDREPTVRHIYASGSWQKQLSGLQGTFQLRLAGPDRALESIEIAGLGSFVRGRNRDAAWSIEPGGSVHWLAPLQAEQFEWDTDFLIGYENVNRSTSTNQDQGKKVQLVSFEQMKAYRIGENQQGVETANFFDLESKYRVGSVWAPSQWSVFQTNIFQHYQPYDTIAFPSRILRRRGESEEVLTITNLIITDVPLRIFRPPTTP
ncbi:MAG: sigma-70 family RNA polymerase sigma factor [Verrucomicrobiales bacterium]|nr:sigma-70 family RNA polymerase sigma factor [Verrucomicrobiales bacterium]